MIHSLILHFSLFLLWRSSRADPYGIVIFTWFIEMSFCLFLASLRPALTHVWFQKDNSLSPFSFFFFTFHAFHDHRRLEIGRAIGKVNLISSCFSPCGRGSSWIEQTYLTLPGWSGGKKSEWKGHKRLDHVVVHLRLRKLCSRPQDMRNTRLQIVCVCVCLVDTHRSEMHTLERA